MKLKMMNVIGCMTAALALSLSSSFLTEASENPIAVVETEDVSTAQPDDESKDTLAEGAILASEESESTDDSEWSSKVIANVETQVNIREGKSTDSARVGTLSRGGVANILERGDEWTKISSGGIEGYIYNKYLAFNQDAEALAQEYMKTVATVVADALNVRQEPNTDCTILKLVYNGATLDVVNDQEGVQTVEGWVPIDIGSDVIAYVSADYVVAEKVLEEAKPIQAISVQSANVTVNTINEASSASVVYEEPVVIASQGDLDILAAIIECEAGGESYDGMIGVGAVVMNRVNSGSFPNSISEVVYQSGQFSPVGSGWFQQVLARGARSDCYAAARDVLNGANTIGSCLFFSAGAGYGAISIGNQSFY